MNNINIPPITKNLLIINALFFICTIILENNIDLNQMLGVSYFDSPNFQLWQPITYMFMHGNFMHIFFNMFALYSFGSILEMRWGAKKYLIFYFVTGLGALFLQWAVQAYEVNAIIGSIFAQGKLDISLLSEGKYNPMQLSTEDAKTLFGIYFGNMVGASGAIFGLLVGFGLLYPNAELMIMFIPVPVKAKFIIPFYLLIELSLGIASVQGDSVAHYAHIGGALIGFILIKIWRDKETKFYNFYE